MFWFVGLTILLAVGALLVYAHNKTKIDADVQAAKDEAQKIRDELKRS